MCDWMAVSAELMEPIWRAEAMYQRILQSLVIQTERHPGAGAKPDHRSHDDVGRLWIYLGDYDHPFLVYDYTPDLER